MRQQEVIPAGNEWREANIRALRGSVVDRIGSGWILITAGDVRTDKSAWNTMTASWGALGVIWNRDVAICLVRPSRHTFSFINKVETYSLSFFDGHREALNICGSKSGRDTNKAAAAGLTPIVFSDGTVGFQQATEVISCAKLYTHDLDPARFLDGEIAKNYPDGDYHRLFIGRVLSLHFRPDA
ncbi:MAG: flavin reductase [Treponema sp.]|jgi:flavin reductase (DIM6/NTAB) family NADH-FMN oxidoreductase RutF|nr:flavin reductase [Treponema sp.]